ncbi:MAG: hypothetical protein D6768_18745 [Chloroflexi bacterium]|nr:MAG: hypothetical protein D6768_18745 [Chloroflexota bacterium]
MIAPVEYHLSIPTQTHFLVNPSGNFKADYREYAAGFILILPENAKNVTLGGTYTLQFADKRKKEIRIERKYKNTKHRGKTYHSFWVKITPQK